MAMILKNHARDFIFGAEMDFSTYSNAKIDIHHIFPKEFCVKQGYDSSKWNSIVNKTPISASSNREIGGVAPSVSTVPGSFCMQSKLPLAGRYLAKILTRCNRLSVHH